jgi:hypothetical protein
MYIIMFFAYRRLADDLGITATRTGEVQCVLHVLLPLFLAKTEGVHHYKNNRPTINIASDLLAVS